MPVQYSKHSSGPMTRMATPHGPHYYEDISTTGAAVELALELKVDISQIEGTGKGGRITVADVRAAAND